MKKNLIALCVALGLCLALPGAASAGKKNKSGKRSADASPSYDYGDHAPAPKRGLGKGGVPRLRDHLVYTIHRVDELEEAVEELDEELGDGMEMLAELIGDLQGDLSALESRVEALEELARDDDEDGFSENLGDCDDADPLVNPAADEVPDNGVDDDCDFDIDELDVSPEPEPLPEI